MYVAQVPRTPGVHLVAIADLSPANARASLERVGWKPEQYASASLDDDLHGRVRDERVPIVREVRPPLLQRRIEGRASVLLRLPAHALEAGAGIRRRKVGDGDKMHTRCARYLRNVHGAEFACAYDSDPQRPALRLALPQLCEQIHAALSSPCSSSGGVPSLHGSGTSQCTRRQSSGKHFNGVKSRCAMYPGRLKRRIWFDTAHRLRYTLTRFQGERFEVEACTRQE